MFIRMASEKGKSKSKAEQMAGALGVVRISHRRAVDEEALLTDLARIGPRLGRSSATGRRKRRKKRKRK
jgi:hypothetical protein